MKLKAIHCYQYIKFQGKNENFLTARKGFEDLELETTSEGLVSVKSGKDHVLVSWTNIAYAVPLTVETAKRDMSTRGQMADISPSSPKKA